MRGYDIINKYIFIITRYSKNINIQTYNITIYKPPNT